MKKTTLFLTTLLVGLFLSSCAGIKYLTVETREPALIRLPPRVLSVIVANNVLQQPDHIGHTHKELGRAGFKRVNASSDSVAIYYTEALSQFLEEEDYYQEVLYLHDPLREDLDFFREEPLTPELMNEIRDETDVDAIISLDKLVMETEKSDIFERNGICYSAMMGRIHSTIRVYLPTMEGKIPAVRYTDSTRWEGYSIPEDQDFTVPRLPTREEALRYMAVKAAEKMVYAFAPHWEMQDRWYYTHPHSLMRKGASFAQRAEWVEAIEQWETFYHKRSSKRDKARAASNIALAYEMLNEMESALQWATIANDLFKVSTNSASLDRRRSWLLKTEIERRRDQSNNLNMEDQ